MTDEQIVKALECCTRGKICRECPLKTEDGCMSIIRGEAVDLINRQKAEIERLKKESNEWARRFINRCRDYELEIQQNEKLKAEIERLQHYKQSYDELKAEHLELIRSIKTCQIEVIKEFAERLKNRHFSGGMNMFVREFIDNLVKEMVGETND